mmetsp:Transcript_28665/g.54907  ORF Transcript_28665/g.54907 Transcript_28665/m.54907 type:complete len:104 (+) Transcript_28665:1123-1434(+)
MELEYTGPPRPPAEHPAGPTGLLPAARAVEAGGGAVERVHPEAVDVVVVEAADCDGAHGELSKCRCDASKGLVPERRACCVDPYANAPVPVPTLVLPPKCGDP